MVGIRCLVSHRLVFYSECLGDDATSTQAPAEEGTEEEMRLMTGWVFVGSLSLLSEETQSCQVMVEVGGKAVSLDSFHEIFS
jgi:hypothetical protein